MTRSHKAQSCMVSRRMAVNLNARAAAGHVIVKRNRSYTVYRNTAARFYGGPGRAGPRPSPEAERCDERSAQRGRALPRSYD